MSPKTDLERTLPCPDCQAGLRRLQYRTFCAWAIEDLITVPDFPTWVCDFCGCFRFDPRAMAWLRTLLNPPRSHGRTQALHRWRNDENASESQPPLTK